MTMRKSITLVSFATLILALAAWAGVWLLFSDISARLTDRAQTISSSSSQSQKQAGAIALHTLLANSASDRAELDAAVNTDVVGIANDISSASKAAGAQTNIGSATAISSSAAAGVNEVEFVVQSSGTFSQVWRAAQLFQTLPLASRVSEIDFEQLPNSGGKQSLWQLTAHIDVLTTAQISS